MAFRLSQIDASEVTDRSILQEADRMADRAKYCSAPTPKQLEDRLAAWIDRGRPDTLPKRFVKAQMSIDRMRDSYRDLAVKALVAERRVEELEEEVARLKRELEFGGRKNTWLRVTMLIPNCEECGQDGYCLEKVCPLDDPEMFTPRIETVTVKSFSLSEDEESGRMRLDVVRKDFSLDSWYPDRVEEKGGELYRSDKYREIIGAG